MMTLGRAFPFLRGVLWSPCVGLVAGCFGRTTMDASPGEFDEPEVTSPTHLPEAEPRPGAAWAYQGRPSDNDPRLAALGDGVVLTVLSGDPELAPDAFTGAPEPILARFARDGEILWSHVLTPCREPVGVTVGTQDRIFVACILDIGVVSLLRYDREGNQQVASLESDAALTDPSAIVADGKGAVYVTSLYTAPGTDQDTHLRVCRYDEEGHQQFCTILSHHGYAGGGWLNAAALTLLDGGGVVTGGTFIGSLQWEELHIESEPAGPYTGPMNGFLTSVSDQGSVHSLLRLGGPSETTVLAVAGLKRGELLVKGYLEGPSGLVDLDAPACRDGYCDYTARLDAQGKKSWAFTNGGYSSMASLLVEPGETRFYMSPGRGKQPTTFEAVSLDDGSTLMTAHVPSGEPHVTSMVIDRHFSLWVTGESYGELDLGNGNVLSGDGPMLFLARYDRAAD